MTIHLLSGPVRHGKTTRLAAWAARTPGVAGLLMPDEPRLGRVFQDIGSGARWPTAARLGDWRPLVVGRFAFSQAAFDLANAALRAHATDPRTRWLVLDEIGPLELRHEGLAPALRHALALPQPPPQLVLVVRETLRSAVINAFGLSRWPIKQFKG